MLTAYTDFIANFLNDSVGNLSHTLYDQVWVKEAKIKVTLKYGKTDDHWQLTQMSLQKNGQRCNIYIWKKTVKNCIDKTRNSGKPKNQRTLAFRCPKKNQHLPLCVALRKFSKIKPVKFLQINTTAVTDQGT